MVGNFVAYHMYGKTFSFWCGQSFVNLSGNVAEGLGKRIQLRTFGKYEVSKL